jgi:hypothetical protein
MLGLTPQTVGKWRRRFATQRLLGLHERPPDAARWSSRRLATALGISQRAVLRIWRTFEL